MKYFTLTSLVLLAAAAQTHALETTSSSSNTTIEQEKESVFAPLGRFVRQASFGLKHIFDTPKDLIKARIEVPKAKTTEKLVRYEAGDNFCIEDTSKAFWGRLYKERGITAVEKVIFCPNAPGFLKDLDVGRMMGSAAGDQLRDILAALMLRKETLVGPYSGTFVDSQYFSCFNALWTKVDSVDPSVMDYWPCDQKSCSAKTIKDSFAAFTAQHDACRIVMKDQMDAYACRVADAATANKITAAPVLRQAILENLNEAPHLTLPIFSTFDLIREYNETAAAAKIEAALADAKNVLKRLNPTCKIYSEAEALFHNRLMSEHDDHVQVAPAIAHVEPVHAEAPVHATDTASTPAHVEPVHADSPESPESHPVVADHKEATGTENAAPTKTTH